MPRKKLELGATCSTCDYGDRKSLMQSGQLFCKRDEKRVSTNGVCGEYKHAGSNLAQIERRAREGRLQLVIQPDLFST